MKRCFILLLYLLFAVRLSANDHYAKDPLKQILYNGRVWRNLYIKITGDPFFLSENFLPGTVTISGNSFSGLKIRYEIYNDEILILTEHGLILQLNKEMVEGFSLQWGDQNYKFRKFETSESLPVSGYINMLYEGKDTLLVKYRKEVDTGGSENIYGAFFQSQRIFLMKDGISNPVTGKKSLLNLMADKKQQIRDFIKAGRIIITRKQPDSFIPVLEFYYNLK